MISLSRLSKTKKSTSLCIPTVKAEVLYEYDSKHRAVNMSASSHEEKGVS